MTFSEEWPTHAGRDDLVHAIGANVQHYNSLENALTGIFHEYLALPYDALNFLFETLHNRARVDLIKALLEAREPDADIRAAVLHCLKCFDICTENRNILIHATNRDQVEGERHLFTKSAPDKSGALILYWLSVDDIRRAADSTSATYNFLARLWLVAAHREKPEMRELLRDRPPLPRKLSLFGHREAPLT